MKIKITGLVAGGGNADEYDIVQIKKALNQLGCYMPYEKVGIIGMPDRAMFEAIKKFQKENGIAVSGEIRPGDSTENVINKALLKKPEGYYLWRTVEDGKVRASHAQYNRKLRKWSNSPDPGDDFNCRCWAQAVSQEDAEAVYGDAIKPVYPEMAIIMAAKAKNVANLLSATIKYFSFSEIKMNDTNTWPQPPVKGKFREGLPSRNKPKLRGEKSLYDEQGGEWRIHKEDKYHYDHWDYKSSLPKSKWENIKINNKVVKK